MKILMLNPPFLPKYSRSSRSPAVTKSGTIYYPLWLSYATGVLEKADHEVLLIDAPAEKAELEDIKERIMSFQPDIAVFDTSTPSILSDISMLEKVKEWYQGRLLTVLVGTHPSALPEETLNLSPHIDVIARKEYDYTLREIADKRAKGNTDITTVQGISYRNGNIIIHNEDRPYITDMDEIPFVSSVYKKHLNINNYFYAHVRNPTISFFGGRGCPNKCFYCVYPQVMFGNSYRHRSPENIIAELEYIQMELPEVKEILIDDDNFTADQEHVLALCDLIIKKKLKVSWTVEARVNLRLDVMKAMRKAGCRMLVAGFESGDQQILNNINKGATIEQAEQFALNAKKVGLRIHGCFMVGNKGETRETMNKTLQFALKLNPDTAQFFPLMVYPGTRAYLWAQDNSFIRAESYRDWLSKEGLHNCVLNTPSLTAQELVSFCDDARRKFYLRPQYIARKAIDVIMNPSEIRRTVKAAKVLFKHLVKRKQEC
jgi:anaerobic magnesium-protoporphyrin IX monomethyl ester cyclase